MVSFSRIFFLAFPFLITLAALAIFLIVSFLPFKISSLFLFDVDLAQFSIDQATLGKLVGSSTQFQGNGNVTAAALGLDTIYRISLWGFCTGSTTSALSCSGPTFDWASHTLNTTYLTNIGQAYGLNVVLPDTVNNGLTTFTTSIKWIEVLDAAAAILLGLEFFLSFFTGFSRVWSCLTYIVAGIATSAVIATAVFATVIALSVVATLQSSAKMYGVASSVNTTFLALIWAAAALCVVAGMFWCLSICCCAPDHASRRRRLADISSGGRNSYYQPIGGQPQPVFYNAPVQQQSPQMGTAYEPYTHHA